MKTTQDQPVRSGIPPKPLRKPKIRNPSKAPEKILIGLMVISLFVPIAGILSSLLTIMYSRNLKVKIDRIKTYEAVAFATLSVYGIMFSIIVTIFVTYKFGMVIVSGI